MFVECNTKKWHGRTCGYHGKGEAYGVSLERCLDTIKEGGYGVSQGTCEYHSRGEEYGVLSERPVGTTVEERVILERPVGTTADWRGMVLDIPNHPVILFI